MHLSIGLIVAVFAVNLIASQEPRILKLTRLSPRTPGEEINAQNDQELKCFACSHVGTEFVTSSSFYSAVTTYVNTPSIRSNGLTFPPLVQYLPPGQINNWQSCTSIWAASAESFLAYGAAIQLQQFTLQIMIQSFTQMMALITTLVQGLQASTQFGQIGSFLDPFSSAIALVLQALQGYFALVTTLFGFEQFVSGCGNLWQQFNQIMAFLVQWGHQQQIWQTNCLQQYGVNLNMFQSAYQVNSITQLNYISIYSSQTLSGSTYIGGSNQFCHGTEVGPGGFIPELGRGVGFEKVFSFAKLDGLLDNGHGPLGTVSNLGKGVPSVVGHALKPVTGLLHGLLG